MTQTRMRESLVLFTYYAYLRQLWGFVTDLYARVFAPPEVHGVRVCPNCEDKLRSGAEVREAHSLRYTSS